MSALPRLHGYGMRWAVSLCSIGTVLAACAVAPSSVGPSARTDESGQPGAARAAELSYEGDLHDIPDPIPPGERGALIRVQPMASPAAFRAYRVLYHSRSVDGATDVAVTGTLWVPGSPAPAGGYPIVVWAPGNNGLGDDCVASRAQATQDMDYTEIVSDLVQQGYVVAYTDYEGHGTRHPYLPLVGESQTHSVLDAARAARDLLGASASNRVILFGHSLGADAVLSALQSAQYADGLDVRGVIAGDEGRDHVQFMVRLLAGEADHRGLFFGVYGYAAAYPELQAEEILTDVGLADLSRATEHGCEELGEVWPDRSIEDVLARSPLDSNGWASRLGQSIAAMSPYPVLYLVGGRDVMVGHVEDLEAEAARLCAELWLYQDEDHNSVMDAARDRYLAWLEEHFEGQATEPPCPN